jgi:hypothetical protein
MRLVKGDDMGEWEGNFQGQASYFLRQLTPHNYITYTSDLQVKNENHGANSEFCVPKA